VNRDRITAIRERLTKALRTGEDTASFRQAIAQLEAAAAATAILDERCAAELANIARRAVEARAIALAAWCHQASQSKQEQHP